MADLNPPIDYIDFSTGKARLFSGNQVFTFAIKNGTIASVSTAMLQDILNKANDHADASIKAATATILAAVSKMVTATNPVTPVLPVVDPANKSDVVSVSHTNQFMDITQALAHANSGAAVVFDDGLYIMPVPLNARSEVALICFDPAQGYNIAPEPAANPTGPTA